MTPLERRLLGALETALDHIHSDLYAAPLPDSEQEKAIFRIKEQFYTRWAARIAKIKKEHA